jgi:hypothetical protein
MLIFAKGADAIESVLPFNGSIQSDVAGQKSGGAIQLNFGSTSLWPNIRWNAPSDSSWDWSRYRVLALTITYSSGKSEPFCVRVDDDITADGIHHCATATGIAAAGKTKT